MLVRQLLIPELDDPTKDHHEFVKVARRPRVFKAWVGEMSDICRDYFWCVFTVCMRRADLYQDHVSRQ